MSLPITSPEDVVNLALARSGFGQRVNSFYDGTVLARKIRDIYSQTRDSLIRAGEWDFAERVVAGNLLKQAPPGGYIATPWSTIYPAPPWLFEYSYPVDCLKVRSVRPGRSPAPNFNPIYNRFSEENDNSFSTPVKVILCDVPSAIVTYAGQVTDPTTWEADFIEALAASLARRFASLKKDGTVRQEAADEQAETAVASDEEG